MRSKFQYDGWCENKANGMVRVSKGEKVNMREDEEETET